MRLKRSICIVILIAFSANTLQSQTVIKNDRFEIKLNEYAQITELIDLNSRVNLTPEDSESYLFRIRIDGRDIQPESIIMNNGTLEMMFPDNIEAKIDVKELEKYIRMELVQIQPSQNIDAILWGPIATSISDIIGEVVGVVRNEDTSIGLQSLHPTTTGGQLMNDEGADYSNGTTAVEIENGSSLQAYSINRNKERTIRLWNRWDEVPVPAIDEETLVGSKIALFLTDPGSALSTIGEIEINENLPHPMIKGEWIKESREPGRPYMISSFSESDADTIMTYAKMAGMAGLYHEDPFETWGHFELRKDLFPNGRKGLKSIVEKAISQDLRLGVHTLTNFITQNDTFVTPSANKRLMSLGSTPLVNGISENDTEIVVKDPEPLKKQTDLQALRIGNELIRCGEITDHEPYTLRDCLRGEFGTTVQTHDNGDRIAKLVDHPYNVFFPDWELQKKLLQNMISFFNETGVTQMDFDGHEGTYATGMGEYSLNTFAHDFYRGTKHEVVTGSSRSSHFYWHVNHYLNWGEPWYGGFRESQSSRRISNQAFLDRNYMPNMLGWFLFTSSTSIEDIDWMMARAAGYDAGFAFVARKDALYTNPLTESLLNQVKIWEVVRQKGIFSADQIEKLKNPDNEFHLDKISESRWELMSYKKYNFSHTQKMLQPGQPTYSEWNFEITGNKEVPQFRFLAIGEDGNVKDISLVIDNYYEITIPMSLSSGQSLVLSNDKFAKIYAENGRFLNRLELDRALPELNEGEHMLQIDADFSNSAIDLSLTLKVESEIEHMTQ